MRFLSSSLQRRPPNIQMQKTAADAGVHLSCPLPASDLGRYADNLQASSCPKNGHA